jgi:hypothetical protein
MRFTKFIFLTVFTIASVLSGFVGDTTAQVAPTLLKRTVEVTPKRFLRYWKNPNAAEPVYNTYSWVPQIQFDILGPTESGSKFYVEFDMPDGKPWLKYNMHTPQLDPDIWETIKMESIPEGDLEKKAILNEGVFPFRIKVKNALSGIDRVFFSGKIKVGTYLLDQKIPDYKGKKDFYIDYDWHLPLAYVWLNPRDDEHVPQLATQICLRGAVNSSKLEAYLFYNGRQVAKQVANENNLSRRLSSAADEPSHRWTIWEITFPQVRGFNQSPSMNNYSAQYFLDKNPGEYEIKVMRDNQLSRSIKFTVGRDGKIVDNGVGKQANVGGVRMIFPAQILGASDGSYNAAAWRAESLFFNPLAGFNPQ